MALFFFQRLTHSEQTQHQGQPDLIGQSGSLPTSFEMDKMLEFRNGQHLGVLKWTTCWSCEMDNMWEFI